jgi:hypothetical protein
MCAITLLELLFSFLNHHCAPAMVQNVLIFGIQKVTKIGHLLLNVLYEDSKMSSYEDAHNLLLQYSHIFQNVWSLQQNFCIDVQHSTVVSQQVFGRS